MIVAEVVHPVGPKNPFHLIQITAIDGLIAIVWWDNDPVVGALLVERILDGA